MADISPRPPFNTPAFDNWFDREFSVAATTPIDVSDLEDSVTTLAGVVSGNTASIASLSSALSALTDRMDDAEAAILALEATTHLRASLTPVAVADAAWTAVSLGTVESATHVTIAAPNISVPAADYSLTLTTAFTGPTAVDFGYTTNGTTWTTLATGISSPATITATLSTIPLQFGFYATGAGTFDSGSISLVRG